MRKILSFLFWFLVYVTFVAVFMVSLFATLAGEGDKGIFEVL